MKTIGLALAAATLAGSALAQTRDQSVNLNATVRTPSEACAGGDYILYSCSGGEHRAALAIVAQRELKQKVGNMIADGKCDEARQAALRGGDFDLAQQVNVFCKQPGPQQ